MPRGRGEKSEIELLQFVCIVDVSLIQRLGRTNAVQEQESNE